MKREEELMQIKKERDEMEKHMTDMFDLAFMLNNRNDIMSPQAHYEKLARMVTHYMGSIQQSYGYMADKAIELLEQEPKITPETMQSIIDFLDNNNRYWGETYWEDKNGKRFYTGGFLDGLEGLRDYLKESDDE